MKTFKIILSCILMAGIAKSQSLQDGIKALEYDQFKKATNIFNGMIKSNSATAETYYYLGNTYYALGNSDSAKIFYNKGINLFPQNPYNFIGLGKILLDNNNVMETKINLDKAQALAPKDSKVLIAVADAYINSKNKDIPKAYEALNKAQAIDSKNPDVFITLGDAFLTDNNGGMAITNYEKALDLNPKSARANTRIGVVYTRSRNLEGSEKAFADAIVIDSNYSAAYRDRADLYFTFRKYEKARDSYQIYLQKADSTVASMTKYAYILFLSKDYATEVTVINSLMGMDSSNILLSRLQGYSLYEQKKYPEGLGYMENFFKKSDRSKLLPLDYEYYGKLLAKAPRDTVNKTNRDSLAIVYLQKALELDSSKTDLYTDIGDVHMRSKNYVLAQQAYQKKIESTKTPSAIDYFSLGKSFYFNKEYSRADSAFAKVVELKPAAGAGYLWRARSNSLNEEANKDTTFALFTKYLEIALPDPKSPKNEIGEAYRFIGFYYVKKEDNAKAIESYNKSLEFDPENKEAKEYLKQLSQQK